MKLIDQITLAQVHADSKQDYVFDLHLAQKHNAKNLQTFVQNLSNYFKQSQTNEFLVTVADTNGVSNQDNDLISVTKSGSLYSVTTTYNKTFSGALCFDANGVQQPSAIQVTFAINPSDNSENREIIKIQFVSAITSNYRIVLI